MRFIWEVEPHISDASRMPCQVANILQPAFAAARHRIPSILTAFVMQRSKAVWVALAGTEQGLGARASPSGRVPGKGQLEAHT